MTFVSDNFQEIYYNLLNHMIDNAVLYGKTKMIEDLHFTLTDPVKSLIPIKKNWVWALHEGINRLSFENLELQNPGTAYKYRPNWNKKLAKEGEKFCYSYGGFYSSQVPKILKKLKSKSEREAIISVWNMTHLNEGFERTPCTLTLHFYMFKDKLNCHCHMRTSDVMNLLPYDVFHHTLLQRYIATALDRDLGNFHFTASFAYYQKKRDITGSVKNTLIKLREAKPLEYEEDWRFTDEDRKVLMDLTRRISEKQNPNTIITNYDRERLSKFGLQYVKALVYYENKSITFNGLKEFKVIQL